MSFSVDKEKKKERNKTMEPKRTVINDCKLQANKYRYNNHFHKLIQQRKERINESLQFNFVVVSLYFRRC